MRRLAALESGDPRFAALAMQSFRLPDGVLLRYLDLPGYGVPLVVVHGLGCASSCDYPVVARDPALASRRVVLIDLPGYGFSDKPEASRYGVTAHAQAVVGLVRHLGSAVVDLFGHSMGGAVAIEAAVALGGGVRRLVLSEPNLDVGGGTFSRVIAAMAEDDYARHGHAADVRGALETDPAWAASLAVASPRAVHRDAVSLVVGSQPSWRTQLLGLQVPRVMIFGEHSLPDPDHEGLPAQGVGVDVVASAGHSMAVENPSGLARAIARALDVGAKITP